MRGTLALLGSGEYTSAMVETDQFLLSRIKEPKVVLFATAAAQERDFMKWIKMGQKHFEGLGIEAVDGGILSRSDAESKEVLEKIYNSNFYYFSGGDPGYLLSVLKGSKAWSAIKDNYSKGSVLAGCSAGAMVIGSKVWNRVFDFHNNGEVHPWEEGLGLVPFGVLAHYDAITTKYYTPEQVEQMMGNLPENEEILGIDEDTAYVLTGGAWKVIGKGEIHKVQEAGRPYGQVA